jgi:hypothetical protein
MVSFCVAWTIEKRGPSHSGRKMCPLYLDLVQILKCCTEPAQSKAGAQKMASDSAPASMVGIVRR